MKDSACSHGSVVQTQKISSTNTNGLRDARIIRALEYISQHHNIKVAELAKRSGLSLSGFENLAKRELGMSFTAYIRAGRMREARRRLIETGDPIKTIGYECGVPDPSNFCHQIKKWFGKSPQSLRMEGF